LPDKNTLTTDDALAVEVAYRAVMDTSNQQPQVDPLNQQQLIDAMHHRDEADRTPNHRRPAGPELFENKTATLIDMVAAHQPPSLSLGKR
jgi:hypothetical protein